MFLKPEINYNTRYLHIFDSVLRAIKFLSYFDWKIDFHNFYVILTAHRR